MKTATPEVPEGSRVVSCIRPTTGVHIGQYFGALVQWRDLQRNCQCFYAIADLHQLALPFSRAKPRPRLNRPILETAKDLLACGIDPTRALLFIQSLVAEHAQLASIFAGLASYGELRRIPLFKSKSEALRSRKHVVLPSALLTYPVLQAADLLLYQAQYTPVGEDQIPHVEFANSLGKRFNQTYHPLFTEKVRATVSPTPRIMSLQVPESKMSRRGTGDAFIGLFEPPELLRKKVQRAVTDPGTSRGATPRAGVENLFRILQASGSEAYDALYTELSEGRLKYQDLKEEVVKALTDVTTPLRERRASLKDDEVSDLLQDSSAYASRVAAETLARVQEAVGLPLRRPIGNKGWWRFSTDRIVRLNQERNRLPDQYSGRDHAIASSRFSYQSYLGLASILTAQTPVSEVPDERVFIITHQAIELFFKQCAFDIAVLTKTFRRLISLEGRQASRLIEIRDPNEEFWRPAMRSAQRLRYASSTLLPATLELLRDDMLFSGQEFYYFRDKLDPASGFQSAQFRLLQRAFGKGAILDLRIFPGDFYRESYGEGGEGPVSVVDPLILGAEEAEHASPTRSPLQEVAQLDDAAHALLARIADSRAAELLKPDDTLLLDENFVKSTRARFRKVLDEARARYQKATGDSLPASALQEDVHAEGLFVDDLHQLVVNENKRRESMAAARAGAFALSRVNPGTNLQGILDALVTTDDSLFGLHDSSFVYIHYQIAKSRIQQVYDEANRLGESLPPPGTGGGGVQYLALAQSVLLPSFPALIAYREVASRDSVEHELDDF